MLNFRTPFNFVMSRPGIHLNAELDGPPDGAIGPFVPRLRLVADLPQSPYDYPDAFRLPQLPLPLMMKVARFSRRLAVLKTNPLPTARWLLTGVTKDSTGSALPFCDVDLFISANDVLQQRTQSDASGNYSFSVTIATQYYIVAYKAGSPDVSGTTVNTLSGTEG